MAILICNIYPYHVTISHECNHSYINLCVYLYVHMYAGGHAMHVCAYVHVCVWVYIYTCMFWYMYMYMYGQ